MSKIMSVFEKLNLVEKVNNDSIVISNNEEKDINKEKEDINSGEDYSKYLYNNVNDQQEIVPKDIEETKEELSTNEPVIEDNKASEKPEFKSTNNLNIKDIYSNYGIDNNDINTIFMLGNFINALPENLPSDVRKQSVLSIIDASNTDLNKLLSDGERRLNVINQFTKEYYSKTISTIASYADEIKKLKNRINEYEAQIKSNEKLLEEQNNIMKFETEKIKNIIGFFKDAE